MSIFSRFRDIVHSNLNSMLEKAEDPEKLIKLMIQEMEDTLVEMKASCAGAMASRARVLRLEEDSRQRADKWARNARLALDKGREDLAREALVEKRSATEEAELRGREATNFAELVSQYQGDIAQLEEKLEGARQKHRLLVQRHIAAGRRMSAQAQIRKADTSDAFVRFEQFEQRIDRMEADAEMINFGRKGRQIDEAFAKLERDETIEQELAELMNRTATGKTGDDNPA